MLHVALLLRVLGRCLPSMCQTAAFPRHHTATSANLPWPGLPSLAAARDVYQTVHE